MISFTTPENQNYGFLDAANMPVHSLDQLFSSTSSDQPQWDLIDRDILRATSAVSGAIIRKIHPGSQDQCNGPVDFSLAQDYCEALDDLKEFTRISFSKERLVEFLTGGTCSAMSFQFADDYLRRKLHEPIEKIIEDLGFKYHISSAVFRTHQAVFNTLHRDTAHPSTDFLYDKVASMLRFYDRSISDSSDLFLIESGLPEEGAVAKEKITSFLSQFSEGVFVIRCIHPENNDKGEAYGHTTLLIQTKQKSYFYDPDEGIFELGKGTEINALYRLVKRMMLKIAIPFGRIYKIAC